MRRRSCLGAVLVAAAIAASACAGDGDSTTRERDAAARSFDGDFSGEKVYPVFASSEVVEGRNRFLIGLLNDEDAPIASPDISMRVAFYDLAESDEQPAFETDAEFIDTGPRGLYVTYPTFDSTGEWGAEVTVSGDGLDETVRASFEVGRKESTPSIGERAPRSQTPTARGKALAKITTDEHPDPAFYDTSIHEALAAGRPFVVTFATPRFCTSAVCAPTLDIVKKASEDWPRVDFIHVEVYENLDDPSNLKPVPAVRQWGLPSEPWVFVVGADRKVAAKFEGTVSPEELDEALSDL